MRTLSGCWLGLGVVAPAPAAAGAGLHWVYEAVGDDAPRREHFVVRANVVEWLDDQGRVLWRHDRRAGTLTQLDPARRSTRTFDDAAVDELAAELARAQALGLGAADRAAPPRPWAAVEAADRWTPLPGSAAVAGVACRRVSLHAGPRAVGEACIADAQALPGGTPLLQMLQALARLADRIGARVGTAGTPAWPLHPLVAAARAGGLPLSVRESLPGERPHEWRLLQRPAGDAKR